MKNKIIFKTLMLKGEAGSTIVSMEKTGHVGTADIYTITFNDGSTTEISLENMSAITNVEKTSSTDTEDIYTITCADGSTQTFSVLNHNADIAAMSDDIDTIDARVDNFINSVVPNTVETLWTGSIKDVGDSATLLKAVSNFDYIDLYLLGSADSKYIRVPSSQTSVTIQQQNLSDDASSNFLRLWEMGVSISGTIVSITKSIAWAWDDPDNSNPTVTANAQNGVPITRIDGVKIASNLPAELTDIRVGADGKTYESAGAAVRSQIGDLSEVLNYADLFETEVCAVAWEHGTINLTDGLDSASNTRIRCDIHSVDHKKISVKNGAKYAFRFYTSANVWVPASDGASYTWYTTENDVSEIASMFTDAEKFRLVLAYSNDGSTATSQEMQDLIDMITVEENVPKINRIDNEVQTALEIVDTLNWKLGSIGVNNGQDGVSTTRARTFGYMSYNPDAVINITNGAKYNIFAYGKDKTFLWAFGVWQTANDAIKNIIIRGGKSDAAVKYVRFSVAYSDDATIADVPTLANYFKLTEKGNFQSVYDAEEKTLIPSVNSSGLGNFSIRCAKEQSYTDGSAPVIEWFLLEEPNSGKFYYSKDLKNKIYLFTFPYDTYKYSFGVLQNGDIIACLDADSIETENKSDINRKNPYVFLASENWSICHEVNFENSIKPCGWLSNCGFKVLADGSAIFCEYTRQTTYTANVWKLTGDPLDPLNWVVTKSFVVTSTDNSTGFKHCHMVMQDFYTGICYMSTGDDNTGAMLFYSSDNGSTWSQLVSPDSDEQVNEYGWITGSEKYCRMLTMTFTENYIYWASDTPTASLHYLFKAERDSDTGVLDYSTVSDFVNIPSNNGASTYGTAYIPELNAIMLLDRCDSYSNEMDVKIVLLSNGTLKTIGKLYPTAEEAATGSNLGFRTRFSEWYPINGLIHFGFGLRGNHYNNDINHNKGFGNTGSWIIGGGANNINNLCLQVFKNNDVYGMKLNTHY